MPLSRTDAQRTGTTTTLVLALLAMGLTLVLAGCTLPSPGGGSGGAGSETSSPAPKAASLKVTPEDKAQGVPIVDAVSAEVADGTITKAVLTNDAGKVIDGILTPDKKAWKPAVPLGYGRTYTLAVTYAGETGEPRTDTRSFTMVDPQNVVTPTLATTGGAPLESGREYGVGLVVSAKFDQAVADRKAVEKLMHVTTEPAVEGAWYWVNDTTAHWRPKDYYPTGTKVRVAIDTNGKSLGGGQYGGDSANADFSISKQRRVAIADDNTKQVTVFYDQKPVRTMPTSMGVGGYQTFNGISMHFWTQPGRYTVLDKASPVTMDSSTYGLPVNSHLGYKETIYNAVRISNDGIYLHQLDSTVWAQGNTDTSHGCLNLSSDHAKWFYDQAVTGDPVEVVNTGGPPLEVWQNGDWSVPWDQWLKGAPKN